MNRAGQEQKGVDLADSPQPWSCHIPLPSGKTATFTFLYASYGGRRHSLVVAPAVIPGVSSGGRPLNDPDDPENLGSPGHPLPTLSFGPFDFPIMLKPTGVWMDSSSNTSASWTKAEMVSSSLGQWVISLDDSSRDGGYEDMVVALVIE
jgi:hypothetical protein